MRMYSTDDIYFKSSSDAKNERNNSDVFAKTDMMSSSVVVISSQKFGLGE
jgi:hypothetical protein